MSQMTKFLLSHPVLAALGLILASACSSSPKSAVPAKGQKAAEWDYERIRQARMNESAQAPPPALRAQEENCVPMSREQMVRAKAAGCRPMNPREGGGVDAFCCPPANSAGQ